MTAPDPRRASTPPNPATHSGGPTPNRTDAAVHPHDADALDAWLESVTVPSSRVAALNGHGREESTADTSSLVAAARAFHTRIRDAEREREPAVPEAEMWERIMSDHLTLQSNRSPNGRAIVAPGMAASATAATTPDASASETPRKRSAIMDVLTGTHPAVSILLAAAVVLAILAVFRSFDETGDAPVAPTEASLDARFDGSESNVPVSASGSGAGSSVQGAATPGTPMATPSAETAAPVELASLGASGSMILQVSSEFTEYPLDGSDPRSLTTDPANPADPSLSAFETTMPNVVVVDDANGTQYLHDLETGESSETFPTFPRMHSVWVVGPYRIIGYTDATDILVTDLRTLEIRYLSGMIGAEITEPKPQFHVQEDQDGNLFVGVTSADPARADAGVAAFVSGSLDSVRPLDRWIAGGSQVNPGAVSLDGSTIAYTVANGETRTLRIESAIGEPAMQYQPPAGGLLEGYAFEDDTHLILFISGEIRRLTLGDPTGEREALGSYPGHLSAFSMSPDGTSVLLSSRFGEDPPSATQWSLLDLRTGELSALPELDGAQSMSDRGDATPTRFVQVALDVAPETATPDLARAHPFIIFDHQTREVACQGETGRWIASSPDQSLLVGPNAGSEYTVDPDDEHSPHAWKTDGHLVVLDATAGETRLIPFPDVGDDPVSLQVAISPDKEHLALTFATGPGLGTTQTWITRTDGTTGWALVGAGDLVSWLP